MYKQTSIVLLFKNIIHVLCFKCKAFAKADKSNMLASPDLMLAATLILQVLYYLDFEINNKYTDLKI